MDHPQFSELALAEADHLYRLAVYLSSRQEADDLVQETFVRAFRSWATFKPDDKPTRRPGENGMRPWLFKILHNVLSSRRSGEQRQRELLEQVGAEPTPATNAASEADGAASIDWDQVDERLRDAIARLPLPHRTVFLLCAVEGLRYREVAAITEVPIGTVMSRLCRARATLITQLTGLAAERRLGTAARRAPAADDNNTVVDANAVVDADEGRATR